ncbi:MAG: restriction endonuclease subunit S, partial [Polaromonas sp.]|nr:restriction endonuclease subunit S [Polaromonas sp.]
AQAVERSRIGVSGDFNLSGERYLATSSRDSNWSIVQVNSISHRVTKGTTPTTNGFAYQEAGISFIKVESIASNGAFISNKIAFISEECHAAQGRSQLKTDDVLFSIAGALGRVALVPTSVLPANTNQAFAIVSPDIEKVRPGYLAHVLRSPSVLSQVEAQKTGVAQYNLSLQQVGELTLPLPPIEVQDQIVAEIEGYQKIIDGARQVLDNYKPGIAVSPDWPVVMVENICTLSSGGTPSKANPAYWEGTIPWVSAKDMKADRLTDALLHVSDAAVKESSTRLAQPGSLLILVRGMGLANGVPICELAVPCAFNQDVKAMEPNAEVNTSFFRLSLQQQAAHFDKVLETAAHGTLKINTADLLKMKISLPNLETQRAIVAEIEAEQALVNANRELIRRMEAKIKSAINRVWGDAR